MTDPSAPKPDPLHHPAQPKKKRGPKPQADLDAVTRVGAEFRAYIAISGPSPFALSIVELGNPESARLAEACANLSPEQRELALAMCSALSK